MNESERSEYKGLMLTAGAVVAAVIAAALAFGHKINEVSHAPGASAGKSPMAAVPSAPANTSATAQVPATTTAAAAPASTSASASDAAPAATQTAAQPAGFKLPDAQQIPDGPMGDVIRRGEQIFLQTGANAKGFVGNTLNCVNCHLDAGRLKDSAPLWGAYGMYPAYRSKTKSVSTFSERLRGCFMYSMNGKAPPDGHEILVALESYAYWMSKGAPTGEKLPGAGFAKLEKPAQKADYARGQKVFEAQCVLCHGANGEGMRSGEVQVFPALWGAQSFNWGAGMGNISNAAAFIKANMPLSKGNSLSDQDAWDVALFIDSQDRPQDPRFTGNVADTRKKFHDTDDNMYGMTVNGRVLGSK